MTCNGHRLAGLVRADPAVAAAIRKVDLRYDACDFCLREGILKNTRPCRRFAGQMMSKLIVCNDLTIREDCNALLRKTNPLPPNLQSLTLEPVLFPGLRNPAELDFASISLVLGHPTLQSLTIGQAAVTVTSSPPVPATLTLNGTMLSRIKSLKFKDTLVEPGTLIDLMGRMKLLNCFTFIRSKHNMPTVNSHEHVGHGLLLPYHRGCLKLEDISTALQSVRETVENVKVAYASGARWNHNIYDDTLLDLSTFSKLKKLTIDPSMLIGRRVCRSIAPQSLKALSGLASVLPTALEGLEIALDREQAARVPRYREEMLRSLLSERKGLPNLQQIFLVESDCTQGYVDCVEPCANPIKCPMPGSGFFSCFGRYPPLNADQQAIFASLKADFERAGVELVLVEER